MKGEIYYVAIAKVIFSHVKITCYFHMRRYQVFVRKLTSYFIGVYIISNDITSNIKLFAGCRKTPEIKRSFLSHHGRELYRYRRGQGFESLTRLNCFQAFLSRCVYNCDDRPSNISSLRSSHI